MPFGQRLNNPRTINKLNCCVRCVHLYGWDSLTSVALASTIRKLLLNRVMRLCCAKILIPCQKLHSLNFNAYALSSFDSMCFSGFLLLLLFFRSCYCLILFGLQAKHKSQPAFGCKNTACTNWCSPFPFCGWFDPGEMMMSPYIIQTRKAVPYQRDWNTKNKQTKRTTYTEAYNDVSLLDTTSLHIHCIKLQNLLSSVRLLIWSTETIHAINNKTATAMKKLFPSVFRQKKRRKRSRKCNRNAMRIHWPGACALHKQKFRSRYIWNIQ